MVFELIIKPIVFDDAEEAINYYEKKLKGLGNRFYSSFLASLNEIQLNPLNYAYIKKPVRRHIIFKFPYKIYYLVSEQTIYVIGISHTKRSNAFVKSRLRLIE
jgi:toxin ParE1/3/4